MKIELKKLHSPDLEKPQTPEEPDCCSVFIQADIGISDREGGDTFNFTVVTPKYLMTNNGARWGSGWLLVSEFSWSEVERMINHLVSGITATTWEEAAKSLGRYMEWEFELYQKYKAPR